MAAALARSGRSDLIRLAWARRLNRYLRGEWPNATYCNTTVDDDDPDHLGRMRAGVETGFLRRLQGLVSDFSRLGSHVDLDSS